MKYRIVGSNQGESMRISDKHRKDFQALYVSFVSFNISFFLLIF